MKPQYWTNPLRWAALAVYAALALFGHLLHHLPEFSSYHASIAWFDSVHGTSGQSAEEGTSFKKCVRCTCAAHSRAITQSSRKNSRDRQTHATKSDESSSFFVACDDDCPLCKLLSSLANKWFYDVEIDSTYAVTWHSTVETSSFVWQIELCYLSRGPPVLA
jgi:hypothetical protein